MAIDKIKNNIVYWDRTISAIPLASTAVGLLELVVKILIDYKIISSDAVLQNHLFSYLKAKSYSETKWQLIPIIGNIAIYYFQGHFGEMIVIANPEFLVCESFAHLNRRGLVDKLLVDRPKFVENFNEQNLDEIKKALKINPNLFHLITDIEKLKALIADQPIWIRELPTEHEGDLEIIATIVASNRELINHLSEWNSREYLLRKDPQLFLELSELLQDYGLKEKIKDVFLIIEILKQKPEHINLFKSQKGTLERILNIEPALADNIKVKKVKNFSRKKSWVHTIKDYSAPEVLENTQNISPQIVNSSDIAKKLLLLPSLSKVIDYVDVCDAIHTQLLDDKFKYLNSQFYVDKWVYAPEKIEKVIDKDPRFIRYLVHYDCDDCRASVRPLIERCLKKNPKLFSFLTQQQLKNNWFIGKFMQDFPEVLEFADHVLRGNKDWLKYESKSWRAVLFIDDVLRSDYDFIKELVTRNGIQMTIGADMSVLDRLIDNDWKGLKAYFLKRPKLLKEVPVAFVEKLIGKVPDLLLCLGRQNLLNMYVGRKFVQGSMAEKVPKPLLNIIFAAQYLPFEVAGKWKPSNI